MKRWLLALAALLGGAVGASYADYIIIQYNLSAPKEEGQGNPLTGGAMMPPGMGGGTGMMPGGQGRGTGAGGMMPGMGGGTGGGMMPGGQRMPGSMPGMGAGTGGGMMPGSMMPGMMPGGMFPGQFAQEEDIPLKPLYVIAVVETHNALNPNAIDRGRPVKITHRWGTTLLQPMIMNAENQPIKYDIIRDPQNNMRPMLSVTKRFEKKWNAAHKTEKASSDDLLDLADWALGHGDLTHFEQAMDELVKNDKDNSSAVAYLKIKADLDRGAAENPTVDAWKTKLGMESYKTDNLDKGHYTLLYTTSRGAVSDTKERLNLLESSFRSFYYWFALQGRTLPVPAERLLAIVVDKTSEFDNLHRVFDDPPLVADGFYARRDNLLILSANRLDEPYRDLQAYVTPALHEGQDISTLLKGKGLPSVQTAVLMLKALEHDGKVATTTQEVPRQLLAGADLLPRNVEVPAWTQFGIGSFFGTAKSSPWESVGSASCAIMPQDNFLYTYKTWSKAKKLDEPKVALERVVTDQYFRLAAKDSKDPVAIQKARTLSWALTFFLARRKLDGLLRYFKELSKLPRDMPFDDSVLLGCFARSFDLVEVNDPGKVNAAKLAQMANEWNDYINSTPTDMEEIIKNLVKQEKESELKARPGAPGQPGAFPGR